MKVFRITNNILRLLVLTGALTLAACGDSNSASEGGQTTTISTMDSSLQFMPADITISVGDTVRFVMTSTHNAIEVSKETYDAREAAPLSGGFQVDFGETDEITFATPGTYYYVCTPHVTLDMVGTITVQ